MNIKIFVFLGFLSFSQGAQTITAVTDVREAEEKLLDTNMNMFEEKFGNLPKPEQVDAIAQNLSSNPSKLLVFAKEIANPVNWFGVFRATGIEGSVMRAVMIAYGLPLPVDFEESLWGKKEHMRDVTLYAVAKHLKFKEAAAASDDSEAFMNNLFSDIAKYSLSVDQVLYAKKCVEEFGDFPYFHNVTNIGDLPVRQSYTPAGIVSHKETFKAMVSSDVEKVKAEREAANITVWGQVGRFFKHAVASVLFVPYAPLRLWFIYDSNKSYRLVQIMCERIMANVEMVKAGLEKSSDLEALKANPNTTPFEALLNYSGMTRTRLKSIENVDRVGTRAIKDLFNYLSIKLDIDKAEAEKKALLEIEAALKASVSEPTNENAKKQFVAIAYSCANPENDCFDNDKLKKSVLETIAKILSIAVTESTDYDKLKAEIITALKTEPWVKYPENFAFVPEYMDDPYKALSDNSFYHNAAPFFVNLKELEDQRANYQPITAGAKTGVAVVATQ